MSDIAVYALMGLAFIAGFIAQGLLIAAREHVRAHHPEWFAKLSQGGSGLRMSGPDERARRALARPLLMRRLPAAAAGDEMLVALSERFRLAITTVALSVAGLVVLMALRMQSPA